MKKAFVLLLAAVILISGCSAKTEMKKYSQQFVDLFDTVITITAFAANEQAFADAVDAAYAEFARLDQIFDRYEETPGVQGLWALNHAGGMRIAVEPELIELVQMSLAEMPLSGNRVNIAMGTVLAIWHAAREDGADVPDMETLRAANAHTNIRDVRVFADTGEMQLADPAMSLDLGAVAKGYAVQRVKMLLSGMLDSFLIDAGGNICVEGKPLDGRDAWTIGVSSADESGGILMKLLIAAGAAVTSGGYQRYFEVDGVRYHHIIDPDTLFPGNFVKQVTILAADSGVADFLSTAIFLQEYEAGYERISRMDGIEAIWVLNDGTVRMTDGAQKLVMG